MKKLSTLIIAALCACDLDVPDLNNPGIELDFFRFLRDG